jgi:hypothetical protein
MKTVNHPSLEIDVKSALGGVAHKARVQNNGRHLGKMPDLFPDVLADVALSKNVGLEIAKVLVPREKSLIRDDEVETGDTKEELPPEEKIPQPAIPVDMKQYLQVIAAVAQTQSGGGEPAPPAAIAAAVLEIIVPGSEAQGANAERTGDDVPGIALKEADDPAAAKFAEKNALKGAVDSDGPKFAEKNALKDAVDPGTAKSAEKKPRDAGKSAGRNDKSSPLLSSGPSKAENLPEPNETSQPKIPKEVFQPKAADVELRVIKVETSFSPAASSPFIVQVAQIIVDSLDGPVHSPVAVIGNPAPDPRPDVVKSIQIQLHPDDLGKIKVAMHLRGDELRLQIEVTSKAVETLLLNDQQALKDLMGQAGYDIKDASISIAVSSADLNPPQRSVAASNPSQESFVGQGGRQHPGASEENQNPFQKARGHHESASDFENGQEAQALAPGPRRGNGVFV